MTSPVRETFEVQGRPAFLIPAQRDGGEIRRPWVWYAPTLPEYPAAEEAWMFERFAEAGMAIAGIDVGESYGNPVGKAHFALLYAELVVKRRMSTTPCLLARSRGGLMHYAWATECPELVACIAGIYPVCDITSYPGISVACKAYGLSEEVFTDRLHEYNPIERVRRLAQEEVEICHIHGDQDEVVPLEENSAELARRYRALGGKMDLEVVEGRGHDLWEGWFRSQNLVDFILARAR